MADNSAEIAEIKSILDSGITSATIKGETVTYNLRALERRLAKLESEDDVTVAVRGKRKKFLRVKFD